MDKKRKSYTSVLFFHQVAECREHQPDSHQHCCIKVEVKRFDQDERNYKRLYISLLLQAFTGSVVNRQSEHYLRIFIIKPTNGCDDRARTAPVPTYHLTNTCALKPYATISVKNRLHHIMQSMYDSSEPLMTVISAKI